MKSVPETVWPTLGVACVLAVVLATQTTLDSHEALVAQTAREMLRSGDFVNPTFGGAPRWEKPPLAYWCAATSFAVCGSDGEIPARLPAALAAVLGVWIVGEFARRTLGPGYGWLAGAVHATMFWTIGYGRLAIVDSLLTMLTALAVYCAGYGTLYGRRTWWSVLGCWGAAGLTVLAKGPVGVAILAPPILYLWRASAQDRRFVLTTRNLVGGALFAALAFGWPVVVVSGHSEVAEVWNAQSVGRFQEHWGPQTRHWYYYFYTAPWLTLPWFPFAVFACIATADDRARRVRRLLTIWFVAAFVLCSASAGKRAHYILPGLPPVSILAALGLRRSSLIGFAGFAAPLLRPSRRSLLPTTFALLFAAEAAAVSCIAVARDDAADRRALANRLREEARAAPRLVQIGKRDRTLVYYWDRPVTFLSDESELRVGDRVLVEVRRSRATLRTVVAQSDAESSELAPVRIAAEPVAEPAAVRR